jgi:6-pyruvoyltetrahydropterin/6-carboxytetrahydropterin synthase
MTRRYEITLAKEDFKFSVAHFTVFSASSAEVLHGHNYRLRARVAGPETDELGLLVDVRRIKTDIRELCASLDGRTLVPTECPLVTVERTAGSVRFTFGDREHVLPAESVVLMPIVNVSIEELASYAWRHLAPKLDGTLAEVLSVDVEETAGQSCAYSAVLAGANAPAAGEGQ